MLREMVACSDQSAGVPQREPVERGLDLRASGAVVNAARRLMKDGNHRNAGTACRESRSGQCSGDRIEKDSARPELLGPMKHYRATKSGERERPLGKGEEADLRLMCRCRLRHPQVIEIAAAQTAGIAQRDERKNETRAYSELPDRRAR